MRPAARIGVVLATLVVVTVGIAAWSRTDSREPGVQMVSVGDVEATHTYLIPLGTGDRVAEGLPVDVLPDRLIAHVGDVLRITNDDDRGHLIGPFFVGAGQTLTQRFDSVGQLVGVCAIHADGRFELEVLP